jgi:hypothetical protein
MPCETLRAHTQGQPNIGRVSSHMTPSASAISVPLNGVNNCVAYEKTFNGARENLFKLVKHPTRRHHVRQSIDRAEHRDHMTHHFLGAII